MYIGLEKNKSRGSLGIVMIGVDNIKGYIVILLMGSLSREVHIPLSFSISWNMIMRQQKNFNLPFFSWALMRISGNLVQKNGVE